MQNNEPSFEILSISHCFAIICLLLLILLLFASRTKFNSNPIAARMVEVFFGVTLLMMELTFHLTYLWAGRWEIDYSLPLELCSLSLLASIFLLWTGNRHLIDFVFFAGIGGAIQAFATPVIDFGYPHFRYFHFFYVHGGIILTALYYYWIKGYVPTFKGVLKTMLLLNILLPILMAINQLTGGNYMFLNSKPSNGTLLDFLGPYPWYIFSLELVAFIMFIILWLVFRKKSSPEINPKGMDSNS